MTAMQMGHQSAAPLRFAIDRDQGARLLTRATLVAMWVVLSLAAGSQWFGDSPDLPNYLAYYNTIDAYYDLASSRFEYGFQFMAWAAVRLGLSYETLFIGLAALSLGCKFYLFERYLASPVLAAVSYVLGFYLLHEYTQIRAAVGIGFALMGVHALIERRWVAFTLFSIAGMLFHYSMIVTPLIALAFFYIKGREVVALGGLILLGGIALLPGVLELIIESFTVLNPLTTVYFYNDLNIESANIFSFASLMTVGIILWTLATPHILKDDYLRVFFSMLLMSYFALVSLQGSLELALRLRDALAVGIIFFVFRESIGLRQLPPVVLWFAAAAYLFYGYSTTQVLT